MINETRPEHFQNNSVIGRFLSRIHLDSLLLAGLILLSLLSCLILYSTSGQHLETLLRQTTRIAIAFFIMLFIAQIPPNQIKRYAVNLYIIGILLLLAVLIIGEMGKGAQRWLDLGLFRFQPSEMIKITTPAAIAWYFSEHALPPRWKELFIALVLIAIPTFLIAKQPDLGTALLIASSGAAVFFFAGISWRIMLSSLGGLIALTPVLWHFMHDYQRARVITFLNPESDPIGRGYHIIQSKIAIGSGGLYGKGWLESTQAKLEFLPERSTDFIFAVFAEEFGLLGCVSLLFLYLLITLRSLYIAVNAQDTFCRLLAGSLSFTFFVYVFVNIGMVIGILPVVGVPLPLISYGGTSMVTLLIGFGILMSIHTHKNLLSH